uniref:uncharacterized protein LOC105350877 n=1 Tax=Fragaria vesca subsp. vesca TaxID=101020 RepID=UPI0005CA8CB1|nr:PREDICTED: uncharacterized protein LOC105350877 [Fragaria vesca subsp. vesca]
MDLSKFFLSDEWGSYLSHAGQKFESIADFRDKLRKFAVQSGFHYVLSRNDSIYVNAVCVNRDVDHCGWEVLGPVASINQCFYITQFNNVHTCRAFGDTVLQAFDLIFPGNPHLYCYHHLRYNLSRKYKNKGGEIVVADVLQKFFKVAYASTEKSFYFHLKNLRDEGGAAIIDEFIREIPLEHWCRAFFKGCRYGIMANGIAESFNNWIVAERSLPPFAMLDQTRMKEMKMMSERSVESKSWTTKLTPKMEKRLKEQLDRSRVFRVIASHENVYEVRNDKYSYSVDLSTRTCSCVKWQINCFPCAHALVAIQSARLDVYDFIDPYFTAEYYRMCYSFPIAPLSNVDASCSSTEDFILPPVTKRPAGRPKSKRIASAGEKKLILCGRCNKMGHHNKKSCTEPLNILL